LIGIGLIGFIGFIIYTFSILFLSWNQFKFW
jgi:preprotein translocase subunit Sss1